MLTVRKNTLLLIAGIVWLIAGLNVARLGVIEYQNHVTPVRILLSAIVFLLFGCMFYAMSGKHIRRIADYEDDSHPFYRFFDAKSYCIMIFMMSGGIWLRSSGLVPMTFIAFFYTGLGLALTLAGLLFLRQFIRLKRRIE